MKASPNSSRRIFELTVFAMLGTVMFVSKLLMEMLPNIHLLGMLIAAYTVALGTKALIPLYIYVLLNGLYAGFSFWWVPYLYIWTVLWALVMLIPKRLPVRLRQILYAVICALHGLFFGVLYAPAQAWMFGFNFAQTMAWIGAGLWFDGIHAVSNFCFGMLVLPLAQRISHLMKSTHFQ